MPQKPVEITIGGRPYAIFSAPAIGNAPSLIRGDGANGLRPGSGPCCPCCAAFTVTGVGLNGAPLSDVPSAGWTMSNDSCCCCVPNTGQRVTCKLEGALEMTKLDLLLFALTQELNLLTAAGGGGGGG